MRFLWYLWLALALPCGMVAQTVLLLSTGNSTLNNQTKTVLENADYSVTIGNPYTTFTGAELSGVDVVLLFPNNNWSSGDMTLTAQAALKSFVQAGGGLITSEWTNWKVGSGRFSTLKSILPVVSTTQYTGGSTITYTQVTSDRELNAGLPSSFAFNGDNFAGVESLFAAKTGATVYYSSSGGSGGAGVVGWDVGSGRVIQLSTVAGSTQLAHSQYSLLLQNSVKWTAVPEPATYLLMLGGLGLILLLARRRR